MSKNDEKNVSEQTSPAETPEAVEEQTAQVGSEPAAQQNPAPEIPKRPTIVVTAPQGLNLRKGPHVSYAIQAVLPDGDPVEILDLPKDVNVPGWALVETDAGIGWVNTNFLTEAEP